MREGRQLFFVRRPLDPNSNLFHVSFSKQMKNFSLPSSLSPPNFGHSQHNGGGGRGCVGGVSAAVGRNKSHRKRQKWMKRTFRTFSLALFANFEGKLFTSLLQLAPPRRRQVHQGMKLVNFRIEVNIFLRCAGALFISGLVKYCELRCLICKRMATLLVVGNGSIASHSIGVVFRTRGLHSWNGEDGKLGHYGGETNNVKERPKRRGNERLND